MKTSTLKKLAPVIQYFGNLTNHPPLLARLFLIPLMLVCFALLPIAQAAPAPEFPDPSSTCAFCTADGANALANATGSANSAFGWFSLFSNTDASFNTAVGAGSLLFNNGADNTAVGAAALLFNSTGTDNVAVGAAALVNNADGGDNNAVGSFALNANLSGFFNNAHGRQALTANTGSENNAFGDLAMQSNTAGVSNTAIGDDALRFCVDGSFNVAVGDEAGTSIVSASNMVAIGAPGAGPFADVSNTCFIASIFNEPVSDPGTAQAVFVDQFNVLGFLPSSKRFKHDIQPMDKASEAILALKPVIFKYNRDKKGVTQYGLIAEEVAKVSPDLVAQNKDGEILTVRYEQINAMLLNEFLKEHKKAEEQQTNLTQLNSKMANQAAIIAEQQKGIELLTAQLKEQATQIQKVSAQLELSQPKAQVVSYEQ